MPQKCETISYCNPTPYRDPRLRASNLPSVWRFTTMHLKQYPKPQDKEIHLESVHDGTPGLHANQQGVLRTEWGVRQACGLMGSPGNGTTNRCPLSVISTNTLQCSNNKNANRGSNAPTRVCGARKSKAPPVTTFTSSLVLLSSSTGLENEGSLRIYQEEDGEGSLDIWAVIKPGNTKEKIAIFAAQKCGSVCDSEIDNSPEKECIAPELRTVSVKNKGCWVSDWSVAKRRRRSGTPDKPRSMESPPPTPDIHKVSMALNENINPCQGMADTVRTEGEEDGKLLSVVEMVAYLEQRASDQQVSSKPPSLRSTSTITLSKVVSIPQPEEQQSKVSELQEVQEKEGESVRVLEMVAKLESQCLNRQSLREGGDLSRNNSLRRKVGRVLLVGSEPYSLPLKPQDSRVESVPQELGSDLDKLSCTFKTPELANTETSQCGLVCCTIKQNEGSCMAEQETCTAVDMGKNVQSSPKYVSSKASEGNEEPQPGMLFFVHSPNQTLKEQNQPSSESRLLNQEPSPLVQDSDPSVDTSVAVREDSRVALGGYQNYPNIEETEGETSMVGRECVPFRRLVSHEFLETRFKIQLLLEPQQYMAFLPHHIILKIFCLLPTESLAALKCTCHYFKFIIESYGVRPADSRWVSDPRYKDDPCKQCKKRYDRGDVSLCRWHHKPYCQALPYGPGYWMCCRGAHKDTPGCNVGLHDNHWVPAYYSINMPIYKKSRNNDVGS
ncbi:F-box only protein 34-like [Xyrauchen texanus]|uniref:F-box only protein 34-like n=1 Tax=Xyrauchen texanus TaxID=154827 RepID=UPI0022428762|nr:F-box only protein 34-like [Xyrauchen texanus]XP_052001748.1 F-box only protein 34-like [Xyrauchen texanus]XP_052001749.1 F-box only protein 34-like [Xyrauchen texanus]